MPRSLAARIATFNLSKPYPITIPRPNGPSKRWGQSPTALVQRHVRVVDVIRETDDAVTLELETTDGRPVEFRAGQYLTHCFDIGGVTIKRAYSICDAEGDRLACTVKSIDGGEVSGFVHRGVAVGYEYTVLGPSGDFALPQDDSVPLAFLAAGSGITPVISMIETALRRSPSRDISLVYASRRQTEIIFARRLQALVAKHPQLRVVHVLSQPEPGWSGERGRLTGQRAAALLAPERSTEVFLCGPMELMDATAAALPIEPDRIHRERFYAAPQHTCTVPTEPQALEFRASGRKVTQRPGETILDAGLRSGLRLDFSCTVGGCAACKIRVIRGAVTIDEPNCLSDQERADGYILSCSAYAQESAVLDA
ncbi:ferredoxin--NADP reductase [Skermania sp. ID1734]|uniref:ferredoxin--NADP reductase n=1 Tax=Skermania sp. ID1734 TaxID=2597516 RepID=UPI00163D6283|nr:ferredoxin--NADP reductase [Skermania sp. ID1734]